MQGPRQSVRIIECSDNRSLDNRSSDNRGFTVLPDRHISHNFCGLLNFQVLCQLA